MALTLTRCAQLRAATELCLGERYARPLGLVRHPDPNPHPNPKQVAPPAASALLRPFPFLHPSHAQEP